MTEVTFPANESINDHVPEEAEIESISYTGDYETVVYTEQDNSDGSDDEELPPIQEVNLESLGYRELQSYAKQFDDVKGNEDEETLREELAEKQ